MKNNRKFKIEVFKRLIELLDNDRLTLTKMAESVRPYEANGESYTQIKVSLYLTTQGIFIINNKKTTTPWDSDKEKAATPTADREGQEEECRRR